MNITLESTEQEITTYNRIIYKYNTDSEYVNPNCSLSAAKEMLAKLHREYYQSTGKPLNLITDEAF